MLTQQSPKIPKLMTFGIPDGDDSFIFNVRAEGRKRNIYNEWTYTGAKGVVGGEWQQYVMHSRCAIIVDAFIVGEKYEKPYLVFPREKKRPFLVAGLAVGKCFVPLSIFENPLMKAVGSDRAPVILTGEDIYHWPKNFRRRARAQGTGIERVGASEAGNEKATRKDGRRKLRTKTEAASGRRVISLNLRFS